MLHSLASSYCSRSRSEGSTAQGLGVGSVPEACLAQSSGQLEPHWVPLMRTRAPEIAPEVQLRRRFSKTLRKR